jgi:triosephosphate isomerase
MNKKIIIANWKMNHGFDEADQWISIVSKNFQKLNLSNLEIVLCPPIFMTDYIDGELMEGGFSKLEKIMTGDTQSIQNLSEAELSKIILNERPVRLGAQDCHHELKGSFTGDISAEMIKRIGCEYVIIGHSERRINHHETNKMIAGKISSALSQNIVPIICVGEDQETRDQGKHLEFIYKQLMHSLPKNTKFKRLIVAYEPIWSIGTGCLPTAEQIKEMTSLIKKIFIKKLENMADEYYILYGGSVDSKISKEILEVPGIDGLLIGKASLDGEEFCHIVKSAIKF